MLTANLLGNFIESSDPKLVVRLGFTEARILESYLSNEEISAVTRVQAWTGAGVWPPTVKTAGVFARQYLDSLTSAHLIGVFEGMRVPNLLQTLGASNPKQKRTNASYFDPFHRINQESENWLTSVSNKRILIVHPMAKSIQLQRDRLNGLHRSLDFSPASVETFIPPMTNGLKVSLKSFDDHLKYSSQALREKIRNYKTSLLILGAGSYGVPLAKVGYSEGVTSLHIGGCLQLLFGIMGRRWAQFEEVKNQMTGQWLRALLESPPFGSFLIEKSTYW
jgi:hypothetical protein